LPTPPAPGQYQAIIIAVGHKQFLEMGEHGIRAFGQHNVALFDVKSVLPFGAADSRL